MKHASLRLDKLAKSSQRLNKALLLLTGLLLLLSSTCYWAVSRLLESEQQRAEFHFARVMEIVQEHETFLRHLAASYREQGTTPQPPVPSLSVVETRQGGGQTVLTAKGFALSLPFNLSHGAGFSANDERRALGLGVQMTDVYSGFWASSFYASPQLFLLAPQGDASLAIPAAGDPRQHLRLAPNQYDTVVSRLSQSAANLAPLSDRQVQWARAPLRLYPDKRSIVAMIGLNAADALLPAGHSDGLLALAAVVDTAQVDEFERVLQLSVYNQFTLITPQGAAVVGDLDDNHAVPQGLSFCRHGLNFKLVSAGPQPWTGLYAISYHDFLRYAKWPLLGLALTFIAAVLAGVWINHWYKTQIVRPARRAQDRLFESEAFNRLMLHHAPVGLCVVRRSDRQLLLENQRAEHLGSTPALLEMLQAHQGEQLPGELCLPVEGRYLQVGVVAARYEGQDVFLCGCNDITRHVGEARLLAQANRQATAANEAKTVFLATMSHEIRTPLYGVLGNLELLALTDMSERQRQYLEIIQGSSTILFQLISNVLDVSKIESGQMAVEAAAFDPHQLVEEAVLAFTATAQNKGLAIELEIDPQLPARLEGDAGRIRQILHNLLGNAIKFTESGWVRLRLTVQQATAGSVALQWQVTDTGVGIPEKALDELFKPFYQVAAGQDGNGAGLGLSICRRLSELMGGSMRVVSEPGLGSSFSLLITLPVVELPPAELAPPPPLPGLGAPCLNVRVLVAEDNLVSQAVLREQLEALGAHPTVARDGQQALQIWNSQAFDLVITDINMPRMNGYELARALRDQGVQVPIIGVTANALREEGQRCLAVGMNAWVVKPLSLGMLRQALIAHCRRANGLAASPPPAAPAQAQAPTLETAAATAPEEGFEGWIPLSPAMRQLMGETLLADIEQIDQGLAAQDANLLRQRLHSLSGALASVRAQGLFGACQQFENALHDGPLTPALAAEIRALASRLATVAHTLLAPAQGE
ncbi:MULTISPECIES: ATP-binding protein [unclassified Pseudomonas]|uniref:ATP-binding protein n=1 Tax=unclassified Pseudomonas TaxID=196821 RepID=UPI000BD258F9|nr:MULTISPECIES: ATP-binding protein [unclassified Pseudomonas]PVZ12664.1 two-component system capsular synthesis sensor histidine kinase RcsC [Pseudomonas sp. URIL14HWK12:I12]PVZ23185.1 two-component system capsular synthesis sensor histidine kinase RcsC [Pseudomonas sp. URIL14HWK12:I10]PVZ32514.1 two-component system capsular synthesis sensor histidine kinase RcsC [Pseudomonas sp. URIL14HWK12:I11]SNZ13576.1 two-component system, NarL family, capsular synthesis sensor histidine kinase RcsC [Ps